MTMTIKEYFEYTPTPGQKQERRKDFLQTHEWTNNPIIEQITQEIHNRINLSPDRTLN